MKIHEIIIKKRIRKDLGDLEPLKNSMQKYGLMHPIIINTKNILISGERRLKSAQELGWTDIEVKVVDWTPSEMIEFELQENTSRKEFEIKELAKGIRKHSESLDKNIFHHIMFFFRDLFNKIYKKEK